MRALLATALLLGQSVWAQDPFFTARRFGVEDGLLHRRVNAVAQDADGFLWIATPMGLHRFDGYTFKPFTEAEGLGRNQVLQIWTDASGLLWLVQGSLGDRRVGGIDVLDPRTGSITSFRDRFGDRAPLRADELFLWCSTEKDGTLLLASPGRMVSYHPERGFTAVPLPAHLALFPLQREADGGLLAIAYREGEEGDLLVRCGPEGRMKDTLLRAWSIERAGACPMPMADGPGVYLRCAQGPDQATEYWVPAGGQPRPVSAVANEFADDMPRLPLGEGLWCVRSSVRRMLPGDDPSRAPVLFDVASSFPDVDFHVHHVFRDRAGHLWIGAEFGLYQLTVRQGLFQRFLWADRIPKGHGRRVRGIAVAGGQLHVNTEAEGYWVLDPHTGKVLLADTTRGLRFAMAPDGRGGLWRSCGDSLLHTEGTEPFVRSGAPVVLPHAAWCVLPVAGDAVLAGCNGGLFHAGPQGRVVRTGAHDALQRGMVIHLARDRSQAIWACTSAGLFRLDEQGRVLEEHSLTTDEAHRFPTNDIRHFHEDADGVFWVSTGDKGLLRWDRKANSVQAITRAEGLPSNGIYAVLADAQDRFWMPTDHGLVRYTPATGAVATFTTEDGIAHTEFNRLAYAQGEDGRIYFGGLNGLTAFDPARFRDDGSRTAPPLVISAVNQFMGKRAILVDRTPEVRAGEPIVMHPGDRYFTVAVALLGFADPAHLRYAWRVDGIDADWNEQREPVIRFTDLPYGDHVLRVKAQGPGGVWSPQELAIAIEVVRPWYLRWWAISAMVLLFLATVYGLFRYRLEQLRRGLARSRDPLTAVVAGPSPGVGRRPMKEAAHEDPVQASAREDG